LPEFAKRSPPRGLIAAAVRTDDVTFQQHSAARAKRNNRFKGNPLLDIPARADDRNINAFAMSFSFSKS
jgi:hypothetical protein